MIRLVMSREIAQRLRSKGLYAFTAFLCLAVIAIGVLNRALQSDDAPRFDVAVLGAGPTGLDAAMDAVAATLDVEVRTSAVDSRADAEQRVRDGDLDAVVDADRRQLLTKDEPSSDLSTVIAAAWQQATAREAATAAGLDAADAAAILDPPPLDGVALEPSQDDERVVGRVVGSVSAILLFISINAFGGMVLSGVVEEKSTGVVEVLLSHVRAHQLLAGKVLGIGVVAMMQFASAVAAGLVSLRISGQTVPGEVWVGLPTTVLWFVVGFVFYSTLFALAGSFVSRQEDAQGAAAPISMVFTAAYIAVFALGAAPQSTAARICSVLPPFAPLLMPLRVATGTASIVEIVAAAVLLLAATAGSLRIAGGVYARTLLHRGSRLTWRQALRRTP